MTVDEFLGANSHSLKKEMMELRKIIKQSAPALTEHIKWNAPSFCQDGEDKITFNLSKPDAIVLVFHRGAKATKIASKSPILKTNAEIMEWPAPDRGVLKLKSMTEITALKSKIATIVKDWIAIQADYAA